MNRAVAWTVVFVLGGLVVLLFVGANWHQAAMKRAQRHNAELLLEKAFAHYKAYGVVTNPLPSTIDVFLRSDEVTVGGSNYVCILGLKWKNTEAFSVAATPSGEIILFEQGSLPKVSRRRANVEDKR
ncbi:MAG TPA: hypothetical protein VN673_11590 [Clostridia bacterium]|nr:hypothetical protein [Clostridia bacterium]